MVERPIRETSSLPYVWILVVELSCYGWVGGKRNY